jgi:hypothetical protein
MEADFSAIHGPDLVGPSHSRQPGVHFQIIPRHPLDRKPVFKRSTNSGAINL